LKKAGKNQIELDVDFFKTIVKGRKAFEKSRSLENAEKLLDVLRANPFQNPPPYEKLVGDLEGVFSRRINIQHRLIYQPNKKEKVVRVLRMRTHYE